MGLSKVKHCLRSSVLKGETICAHVDSIGRYYLGSAIRLDALVAWETAFVPSMKPKVLIIRQL